MTQLDPNQHYLRTALALAYGADAAYHKKPASDKKFAALSWDDILPIRDGATHTQGFVAGNADNVVVAFRGTEPNKFQDWLTDLGYRYYKRKVAGGHVHHGFWTAWKSVEKQTLDALKSLHNNRQAIWFTGHSLGGALATLSSRVVPTTYKATGVHTFGSPRVGSPAYAKAYKLPLLRFVNEQDIVPHVPFQGLFIKYSHVGKRQILTPDGRVTSNVREWKRLLRWVAQAAVMGVGSLPAKAIQDHSMVNYIGKLEKHYANRH